MQDSNSFGLFKKTPSQEEVEELVKMIKKSSSPTAKFKLWTIASIISILIMVFGVVPLIAYFLLSAGFVATKLWLWFVVPFFHLPSLSLAEAVGLLVLVRLISGNTAIDNSKWKNSAERIAYIIGLLLSPWMALLTGYIIHLYL